MVVAGPKMEAKFVVTRAQKGRNFPDVRTMECKVQTEPFVDRTWIFDFMVEKRNGENKKDNNQVLKDQLDPKKVAIRLHFSKGDHFLEEVSDALSKTILESIPIQDTPTVELKLPHGRIEGKMGSLSVEYHAGYIEATGEFVVEEADVFSLGHTDMERALGVASCAVDASRLVYLGKSKRDDDVKSAVFGCTMCGRQYQSKIEFFDRETQNRPR